MLENGVRHPPGDGCPLSRRRVVLITGGCGFIGSHLCEEIYRQHPNWEIRILDSLRSGKLSNVAHLLDKNMTGDCESRVLVTVGSILDRECLRRMMQGVDVVFHLAAFVSVAESMEHVAECMEINCTGTALVLEEATRARVQRLILSSTSAVYGASDSPMKLETQPPDCLSPYAQSKADGEGLLRFFQQTGRLETCVLRLFNVFGPRQDTRSPYAAVVPRFMDTALSGGNISIFGDGGQSRDFVHVHDVARAFLLAAELPAMAGGIFNVGYGQKTTILQLAQTVLKLLRQRNVDCGTCRTVFAPERAGEVRSSVASVAALLAVGWQPQFSVEDGLAQTIDALLAARTESGDAVCSTCRVPTPNQHAHRGPLFPIAGVCPTRLRHKADRPTERSLHPLSARATDG